MTQVQNLYNHDQIKVYEKDSLKIMLVVQVGLRETKALLREVGPHCIDSWIPRMDDHQLVVLKVLRNTLPELFRKQLLT
jgi:hypothetical protein